MGHSLILISYSTANGHEFLQGQKSITIDVKPIEKCICLFFQVLLISYDFCPTAEDQVYGSDYIHQVIFGNDSITICVIKLKDPTQLILL